MENLIGKHYGRLTVIKSTGKKAHSRENVYLCKCDCGSIIEVRSGLLTQEKTKSCGCLYNDTRKKDMSELDKAKKYVDGIEIGLFDGRFNKNNTSGFKGVSKHGSGYRAKITVKGHVYFGSTRATKEEAYKDRLKFEEELLPKANERGKNEKRR